MTTRRFECVTGGHDKFWEISYPEVAQAGSTYTVTVKWGRRFTTGQVNTRTFGSKILAHKHISTIVAEKLDKGYYEVLDVHQPKITKPEKTLPNLTKRGKKENILKPDYDDDLAMFDFL